MTRTRLTRTRPRPRGCFGARTTRIRCMPRAARTTPMTSRRSCSTQLPDAHARLPTVGLLSGLKADGSIYDQTFTAVGYGTVREDKTGGPHAFFFDGIRRYALQSFLSLQKAWLTLNMNPSTGSGGTCYGDSGGPHFLGGVNSNLIVSVTVTGDAMCRATDKTYRIDTPWARDFLEQVPGVNYPE